MSRISFFLAWIVTALVLPTYQIAEAQQLELSPGQVVTVRTPTRILVGRRTVGVLPSGSLAVVVAVKPDVVDTCVVRNGALVRAHLARDAVQRLSVDEYLGEQLAGLLHEAPLSQKEAVLIAIDRVDPNLYGSNVLRKALFDVVASSGNVSARRKALSILAQRLQSRELSETERAAVLSVPADDKTIKTSLDVLMLVPKNAPAQKQVTRAFAEPKETLDNLSLLCDRLERLDREDRDVLIAFLRQSWQQKWSHADEPDLVSEILLRAAYLSGESDNNKDWLLPTWINRLQDPRDDVRYRTLLQLQAVQVVPKAATVPLSSSGHVWGSPLNLEGLLRARLVLMAEPEKREAVEYLVRAVHGESLVYRQCAREILLGSAPWLPEAVIVHAAIEPFLKSDDAELRALGCDLLGRCSLDREITLQLARLGLDDSVASVRRAAVLSLRRWSDPEIVGLPLSARFKDSDATVRRAALDSVPQQPLSEHPAPECLNDPDPSVRAAALRILGRVTGDSVVQAVSRAIRDKCPDVREAAAVAIRDQVQRGRSAAQFSGLVAPLVALLDDPSSGVRKAAVSALSSVDGDNLNTAKRVFIGLTDENRQWDLPYLPPSTPDQTVLQRHGVVLTPAVCTLLLDDLERLPARRIAERLAIIAASEDRSSKEISQMGYPQYIALLQHQDTTVRTMAADTIRHVSRIAVRCAWTTPPPEIWPPPLWTSRAQLKRLSLPQPQDTYGNLFDGLVGVLSSRGYCDRSLFVMEPGFVVLTRLERIDPSGNPNMQHRWTQGKIPLTSFNLWEWLQRIFTEPSGDFRLFLFVVSPRELAHSGKPLLVNRANELLTKGRLDLPSDVRQQTCDSNVPCVALIYHFVKKAGDEPTLLGSGGSNVQGIEYLQRAGLVPP